MVLVTASTATILRRAAALIAERGWVQDAWEGPGGELCLQNSVYVAADSMNRDGRALTEFVSAFPPSQVLEEVCGILPQFFNDTRGRTQEQVLAALEQAAANAEEGSA